VGPVRGTIAAARWLQGAEGLPRDLVPAPGRRTCILDQQSTGGRVARRRGYEGWQRRVGALGALAVGFAMTLAAPRGAQAGWTSIGPDGGWIQTLAIDPATPSTLYAGTFYGLFKSTDGGASWTAAGLTYTNVQALAID